MRRYALPIFFRKHYANTIQVVCTVLLVALITACSSPNEKLFEIVYGPAVGVKFRNNIQTSDSLNALSFEYIYNGAGIGVGDFDNDGLEDLFFAGNQVSSKLYQNKGNFTFKDISTQANIHTSRWITGVTVFDVNADGLLDIYLCVGGKTDSLNRKNMLFINQGVKDGMPVFNEEAEKYGIADTGYSTMAAFFDYDKDGDNDLYIVNNWLEIFNRNNVRPIRMAGEAPSNDKLYQNNGNLTFTDVSRKAGILIEGYGLGISVTDINQDSWPDLYISNDFMSNDILWVNQKDGTFKNEIDRYVKHLTHNGMGIDVADFNNDLLNDIVVVDMLPPDHRRQKLMTPGQNYDHFHMSLELGYQPQYMRNTLQLNRGVVNNQTQFSEIAFMAGVAKTDWSWAPLFFDADNDGDKDLFIGNGYRKDVTNLDFIFFALGADNPFGTPEARKEKFNSELSRLPEVKLSNYIFENNGTLTFTDATKNWGIELPTFSNGAAYADFDLDGDLDLVTNNIDQEVIFYKNNSNLIHPDHKQLTIKAEEVNASNEKIYLYSAEKKQFIERTPFRGFQSTVTSNIHFGVGTVSILDSVKIIWNDSTSVVFKNIPADTILTYSKARSSKMNHSPIVQYPVIFTSNMLDYHHKETSSSDIKIVRTLLHEVSRQGPCLAAGDVNGDLLQDFFVGSEQGEPSYLFIQQADGSFQKNQFPKHSTAENGAASLFDIDNDQDLDLYVGTTCASLMQQPELHQLYLNDGNGKFSITNNRIPAIQESISVISANDFDQDGDTDLFLGGYLVTGAYGKSPRSYLLVNENGTLVDKTTALSLALQSPGMITDAVWFDYNRDKLPDLAITGEWQPVRIFKNTGDQFTEVTSQLGLEHTHGWWKCLATSDINHDGFVDLLAGNTGKNSFFQPTLEKPIELYLNDFDKNGMYDPIITYVNESENERFIVHNRLVLLEQVPMLKKRLQTFTDYAVKPVNEIFTAAELEQSTILKASMLSSMIFLNQEAKSFQPVEMPEIAQLSTIQNIMVQDINDDGFDDYLIVGNQYDQETFFGRYDAAFGTILLGSKTGKLSVCDNSISRGFYAPGNIKNALLLNSPKRISVVLFSTNGNATQLTKTKLNTKNNTWNR